MTDQAQQPITAESLGLPSGTVDPIAWIQEQITDRKISLKRGDDVEDDADIISIHDAMDIAMGAALLIIKDKVTLIANLRGAGYTVFEPGVVPAYSDDQIAWAMNVVGPMELLGRGPTSPDGITLESRLTTERFACLVENIAKVLNTPHKERYDPNGSLISKIQDGRAQELFPKVDKSAYRAEQDRSGSGEWCVMKGAEKVAFGMDTQVEAEQWIEEFGG